MTELSPKLVQVLVLVADGLTTEEIANELKKSPITIKHERQMIINTLGADNMPHAISLAYHRGILKLVLSAH